MSDMTATQRGEAAVAELFHYGKKGMKWGVRNERKAEKHRETAERNLRIAEGTATGKDKFDQAVLGKGMAGFGGVLSLSKPVAARLAVKYDKKADKLEQKAATKKAHEEWKKDAGGTEMANKVFQKAVKDFEKTADIINNDPNYKGQDVHSGKLGRQYDATMSHYFNQHLAQASVDLTLNDQGRAYIYQMDRATGYMKGSEYKIDPKSIEHAAMKEGFDLPDYKIEFDELGHAVGFSLDTELKHYGVKGMKWGVRNNPDGTVSVDQTRVRKSLLNAKDVTVTQRKAGTYVKTKGGKRQPASTDAVRAHAGRQKAKKSTTDALSNKELKDSIERMRLEQEFKKLDAKTKRKGESFVAKLFQSPEARRTTVDLAKKVKALNA